jgi:hypothetical protein
MLCLVWLDVGTVFIVNPNQQRPLNKVPTAQSSIDIIMEDLGTNKKMMF